MIKAKFFKNEDQEITGFEISGHAFYAESGHDIICAAVSILATTTVNSLEEQLAIKNHYEVDENIGYLKCNLPKNLPNDEMAKAQIILKTMEIGLKSIAQVYSENLKLF